MCDCKSYNWDIGETPEVQLYQGDYFDYEDPKNICIDSCISRVVAVLWSNGIETLGSCCGHNKEIPSIILCNKEDTRNAFEIIETIDSRDFKLMSWQLIGYTKEK